MSLESANFIPGLVQSNPAGTDPKSQGDDHIRLLKHVLQSQFPNFTGIPVTRTEEAINALITPGQFGLGANFCPVAANLDNVWVTGFYQATPSTVSNPTPSLYCTVIVVGLEGLGTVTQLAMAVPDGLIYYRTRIQSTGVWSPWRTITPLGSKQTWQNVTASRAAAVTYTNSTGQAIEVVISGSSGSASGGVKIIANGGTDIGTQNWPAAAPNLPWSISAVIPPAGTYYLVAVGATISCWSELR